MQALTAVHGAFGGAIWVVVALALGFYSTSLKSRAGGQIKEQSHFRLLLTLSMVSRGAPGGA
ncbi:hypothetical protein [Thermogymnomonas acidicola]|uniref:hypothetical protein n=1 Tax=Thermogymnomonas acidicola TaxID=399579 RepID=UPI0009466C21|nr:hypothetical protein [Thermogymnomonas acidicola]